MNIIFSFLYFSKLRFVHLYSTVLLSYFFANVDCFNVVTSCRELIFFRKKKIFILFDFVKNYLIDFGKIVEVTDEKRITAP